MDEHSSKKTQDRRTIQALNLEESAPLKNVLQKKALQKSVKDLANYKDPLPVGLLSSSNSSSKESPMKEKETEKDDEKNEMEKEKEVEHDVEPGKSSTRQ